MKTTASLLLENRRFPPQARCLPSKICDRKQNNVIPSYKHIEEYFSRHLAWQTRRLRWELAVFLWKALRFEKVQNLVQRKEMLMKERRCLKCLAPGHIASSSQNEKVCRHCKQRSHHQSIFPTLLPCESNQPEGDINNTTTTNTVRNKGTVVFQIAKGIAFNEENSKSSYVRILFDNGSQCNYILKCNLKSS